jgi:hypothetical protein
VELKIIWRSIRMGGLIAAGFAAGGAGKAGEPSPVMLKLWNGDPPGMVKKAGVPAKLVAN